MMMILISAEKASEESPCEEDLSSLVDSVDPDN